MLTVSSDIIPVLSSLLTRAHKEGRTQAAFLCVPTIDHIQTLLTDFGWSCGYKNAQMLFSSLRHLECYKGLSNKKGVLAPIPTIKEFQEIVELAWKNGMSVLDDDVWTHLLMSMDRFRCGWSCSF